MPAPRERVRCALPRMARGPGGPPDDARRRSSDAPRWRGARSSNGARSSSDARSLRVARRPGDAGRFANSVRDSSYSQRALTRDRRRARYRRSHTTDTARTRTTATRILTRTNRARRRERRHRGSRSRAKRRRPAVRSTTGRSTTAHNTTARSRRSSSMTADNMRLRMRRSVRGRIVRGRVTIGVICRRCRVERRVWRIVVRFVESRADRQRARGPATRRTRSECCGHKNLRVSRRRRGQRERAGEGQREDERERRAFGHRGRSSVKRTLTRTVAGRK